MTIKCIEDAVCTEHHQHNMYEWTFIMKSYN